MLRARLVVWGGVLVMIVSSMWVASARSKRMQEAQQALNRAQRLLEDGKSGQATAMLTELVREQPRCADAHAILAELCAAQGREGQAVEHYRAVVDLRPRDRRAYYDLAACCIVVERYDIAETYLAQRVQQVPGDGYARRLLSFVRQRRARWAQEPHRFDRLRG